MISVFKNLTFILDYFVLICFLTFTILFYYKINILFLTKLIIIFSIITFISKLLYWYLNQKYKMENIKKNKINLFFSRLFICIFLYITPPYYIFLYPGLIISDDIIFRTLTIISLTALASILIERKYLINL
tara:strand:- start:1316 stop:1708 length:393 start_codon:yes stop_codon:yes gene_type:complete